MRTVKNLLLEDLGQLGLSITTHQGLYHILVGGIMECQSRRDAHLDDTLNCVAAILPQEVPAQANEVIVMYGVGTASREVARRLLVAPGMSMPSPGELDEEHELSHLGRNAGFPEF